MARAPSPRPRVLGTLIAEDALRVAEKILPDIAIALSKLLEHLAAKGVGRLVPMDLVKQVRSRRGSSHVKIGINVKRRRPHTKEGEKQKTVLRKIT